ncbi:MAG: AbrB/MazE/SpoVT family DNA-binding domain-containing protein [Patescibacteria group bacterium]|nr:AbrB/MazE/SpoVT family DNA-binding domain-containing protein [Patescibacteria group bacterium]
MTTAIISPKFQVVIPKAIRETMNLAPGTRVEMIPYGNRIELIPVGSIKDLMGSLKGMDTTIIREGDRI